MVPDARPYRIAPLCAQFAAQIRNTRAGKQSNSVPVPFWETAHLQLIIVWIPKAFTDEQQPGIGNCATRARSRFTGLTRKRRRAVGAKQPLENGLTPPFVLGDNLGSVQEDL